MNFILKAKSAPHRLFVWLFLAALLIAAPALGEERILLFDSTIKIRTDGSLLVVEKIRVRAEGRQIKRGIYRDFPVRYRDKKGYMRKVGLKVISITRDGKKEPWFSEASGDFERIYIGEKNTYLPRRDYTYELTYETTRQLRFFENFDELYWNVTGNNWAFEIDKVIARIELPDNTPVINRAAYTGRFGESSTNFSIRSEGIGTLTVETVKPLRLFEGLTVATSWKKGVVPEPASATRQMWWLWDNIAYVLLLAGTLLVSIYFYIVWRWIGRDPEGGPIFPRFKPPGDLSPAAVSYLHYMGFRRASSGATKPFISALVSLAVKGHITMDDEGEDLIIRSNDEAPKSPMSSGENAMYQQLLGDSESLTFKQSSHPYVQAARSKFKSALLSEHSNVFFKNNYGWFLLGAIASGLVLALSLFLVQDENVVVSMVILTAMAIAGSLFLSVGFRRLSNWMPGGDSLWTDGVAIAIGAVILVASLVFVLGIDKVPAWVPLCGIALGAINVAFLHLLRAPTVLGRQMMDAIDGFKMYLQVAEADRMNMIDAPDVTSDVFEKFLPYAIGLGVEEPWSNAFESHVAKAAAPNNNSYRPRWYRGRWNSTSLTATTAGIVGAVSAGMATASPPSKSGSGGGGFSGGGGGGGGGGGW